MVIHGAKDPPDGAEEEKMNPITAPQAPRGEISPHHERDCGQCTACCRTMYVRDLNKPAGVACKYLTPTGCGVYEHRWDVCKGFVCMWLRDHHGLFTENHRPDKLGLILVGKNDDDTGQTRFIAHEVWPQAAGGDEARRVVEFLGQFGPVRVVPASQPKNQVHDITLTVNGKAIEPAAA